MESQGLQVIVMTFDEENQARMVAQALRQAERNGRVRIEDTAIIRRGMDGKVHVDDETEGAVKKGAVAGGFIGLLIGSVLFPIGGLVLGAAGGALVGKSLDTGIDKKFVKDVTDSLQPGTSALFVTGSGQPDAVVATLRQFKGTVYHTSLSSEAEETLRRAMKGPV